MILASEDQIREYKERGCWGTKTLFEDFWEHVERIPEQTAVVDPLDKEELLGLPPERPTYSELARAVDGAATALMASGIGKDDFVVVQLPNCWELAMLYLAIARTGAVISPLPMQWRSKEAAYVAGLTEAKAFITTETFHGFEHMDMAKAVGESVPSLKHFFSISDIRRMIEESPDPGLDQVPVQADDIFTLCWTSGTEAEPKGCPLSHNNWRCQSGNVVIATGIQQGDVVMNAAPMVNMTFVGTALIPSLLIGGKLVLHHPFNPVYFVMQMVEEKINMLGLVPALMNMLLQHPAMADIDLSSIRFVGVGSAPPSLWAMEEFKKRWNIEVGNVWGQNEGTGLFGGVTDIPDMKIRVDHLPRYGRGHKWSAPMADWIQTKVVDEKGDELNEPGSVGELLYRGPNIIPQYFKRPDLTGKSFDEQGFLRTGDLFQIRDDRHLKFFDRAKDIIIRGGFNISAQEVENTLQSHPKIQEAAAVAMPDETLGERTCVYAVPVPGETFTLEEAVSFMKEQGLAVYKLPERLELIEAIPRNPVGKILKSELRKDIREKVGYDQ